MAGVCMAATAEYCLEHPEDTACSLLVVNFERTVNETSEIELHFPAARGYGGVDAGSEREPHRRRWAWLRHSYSRISN